MAKETRITLRMPDDIRAFLATQAESNRTSQNAEIVRAIRERMERTNEMASGSAGTLPKA